MFASYIQLMPFNQIHFFETSFESPESYLFDGIKKITQFQSELLNSKQKL